MIPCISHLYTRQNLSWHTCTVGHASWSCLLSIFPHWHHVLFCGKCCTFRLERRVQTTTKKVTWTCGKGQSWVGQAQRAHPHHVKVIPRARESFKKRQHLDLVMSVASKPRATPPRGPNKRVVVVFQVPQRKLSPRKRKKAPHEIMLAGTTNPAEQAVLPARDKWVAPWLIQRRRKRD